MTKYFHPLGDHFRCCIPDANGQRCTFTKADGLEMGRHLKLDHDAAQYNNDNQWKVTFWHYGVVTAAAGVAMKAARKDHGVLYDNTFVALPHHSNWLGNLIIDNSKGSRVNPKQNQLDNWTNPANRAVNAVMNVYTPPAPAPAPAPVPAPVAPAAPAAAAATNQPARRYPARQNRRAPARYTG